MFHLFAQIIFWFSVAALFYVYLGYPLLVYAFLMDYYIAGLTAGATKG